MAVREIVAEGFRVQLDLRSQVLELSLPEDRGWAEGPELGAQEVPLAATPSELAAGGDFASASMLAQKAKQFDDGLYAAVELAAQCGAGGFGGKARLLASLAERLAEPGTGPTDDAIATVLAACTLAGVRLDLPAEFERQVQSRLETFLHDELRSKPIGFYTWSEELARIFRGDRLLQTELEGEAGIRRLVEAIHADPAARAIYEGALALAARLTNPLVAPDLRGPLAARDRGAAEAPSERVHFFPPSRSHEAELVKQLYGSTPIPDGFSLIDEMIRRIRAGTLCLMPAADSGWYDYQTWSLEPLAVPEKTPEASRLKLGDAYRDQLLELFKGILALTRETHIKQLEIPIAGAAPPFPEPRPIIDVYPELSAEPLATYYVRRARSYCFVREAIEATFGAEAVHTLHRQTAQGPVAMSLADELEQVEALFHGAHAVVCGQLGLSPADFPEAIPARDAEADAARFRQWLAAMASDPDLGRDARMMVPLFYDVQRGRTKVAAFLGWAARPLRIGFAAQPDATVFDERGNPVAGEAAPVLNFHALTRPLAYPVTAEVYVQRILDRGEFQALCDRHRTRSAILAHLT